MFRQLHTFLIAQPKNTLYLSMRGTCAHGFINTALQGLNSKGRDNGAFLHTSLSQYFAANYYSAHMIATLLYLSSLKFCIACNQLQRCSSCTLACWSIICHMDQWSSPTQEFGQDEFAFTLLPKSGFKLSNLHDSESKLSEPNWWKQQQGLLEPGKMQFHFSS